MSSKGAAAAAVEACTSSWWFQQQHGVLRLDTSCVSTTVSQPPLCAYVPLHPLPLPPPQSKDKLTASVIVDKKTGKTYESRVSTFPYTLLPTPPYHDAALAEPVTPPPADPPTAAPLSLLRTPTHTCVPTHTSTASTAATHCCCDTFRVHLQSRTSKGTFLDMGQDEVVAAIEGSIATLSSSSAQGDGPASCMLCCPTLLHCMHVDSL